MPRFRKYGKRPRKTRRYRKAASRLPKQLYRLKRQIRSLRPEVKYTDYMQSATNGGTWSAATKTIDGQALVAAGTSTPRVFLLNGVSPGTAQDNRIGWKLINKGLNCKIKLALTDAQASDAESRARTRLIMVMDRNIIR